MAPTKPIALALVPAAKLAELYHEDKLTLREIALRYGCSERAVRDAMKRFGINRRPVGAKGKEKCPPSVT